MFETVTGGKNFVAAAKTLMASATHKVQAGENTNAKSELVRLRSEQRYLEDLTRIFQDEIRSIGRTRRHGEISSKRGKDLAS